MRLLACETVPPPAVLGKGVVTTHQRLATSAGRFFLIYQRSFI